MAFYINRLMARIASMFKDEKGETNIIAIVVVLGIVVALAIAFGGKLNQLFNSWWGNITQGSGAG